MKRALTTLLLSATLAAAGTILNEGQAVPSNTPGLGGTVYAVPGSVWWVAFEDTWDDDFNDWVGWVSFTNTSMTILAVSATTAHNVWVSYGSSFVGQTPGSSMTIPLDANGQPITLSFWVPTVNLYLFWYSGLGVNSDGKPHAIVQLPSGGSSGTSGAPGDEPIANPEPATAGLLLGGLGLLAFQARRLRRR